jgi:NTE family protein
MSGTNTIAARIELLSRLPMFGGFSTAEMNALADSLVEVTYHRGDTVCAVGEVGEALFICVSGEVEVLAGTPARVVNRHGPGELFGEMALLRGDPRTATVVATRHTRLLALDKAAFERFFLGNAKALAELSRELSRRLARATAGERTLRVTTIVSITGARHLAGRTLIGATLAAVLEDLTGRPAMVMWLASEHEGRCPRLENLLAASADGLWGSVDRETLGGVPMLTVRAEGNVTPGALGAVLDNLATRTPFVVVVTDGERPDLAHAAEECADVAVRLESKVPSRHKAAATLTVLNLYNRETPPVPLSDCEPFVMRVDPELQHRSLSDCIARIRRGPRTPAGAAVHRLARKVLGSTVAVVLGGGAAFGIAHIGVLKVLENHDIPVDMTVGCSMGALVAMGYAAGMSADALIENALRLGNVRSLLWIASDPCFTKPALLAGRNLANLLMPLIAPYENFDELLLPCRAVATDIQSGERIAIGSGRLEAAGRASSAIPMVFAPIEHDGRVLVDGGVVDPVPAEVARDMGADVCISVNAVPPLRRGVETAISRLYRRVRQANPFSWLTGERRMPSMLDIVMNSMQLLQHQLGNFKAIASDVRICPDMSDFTWIEFYRPQEMIDRGMAAAESAVPEIRRALAERGLPSREGHDSLVARPATVAPAASPAS